MSHTAYTLQVREELDAGGRAKLDSIVWDMTNRRPSEEQVVSIEDLRAAYKELAALILLQCPKSRECSLALTNLEQSLMWAVGSIAREGEGRPSHG